MWGMVVQDLRRQGCRRRAYMDVLAARPERPSLSARAEQQSEGTKEAGLAFELQDRHGVSAASFATTISSLGPTFCRTKAAQLFSITDYKLASFTPNCRGEHAYI